MLLRTRSLLLPSLPPKFVCFLLSLSLSLSLTLRPRQCSPTRRRTGPGTLEDAGGESREGRGSWRQRLCKRKKAEEAFLRVRKGKWNHREARKNTKREEKRDTQKCCSEILNVLGTTVIMRNNPDSVIKNEKWQGKRANTEHIRGKQQETDKQHSSATKTASKKDSKGRV